MIRVVNTRTFNGAHKIYIGRGSPLGNEYSHKEGTKAKHHVKDVETAIERYAIDLYTAIEEKDPTICAELNRLFLYYRKHGELNLACYCKWKGHEPCHGEVVQRILEEALLCYKSK